MPQYRADIANAVGCRMMHNANSSEGRKQQSCCMAAGQVCSAMVPINQPLPLTQMRLCNLLYERA